MATKTLTHTFPHSLPGETGAVLGFFKKIGHFFAVGFEVFAEAQEQARKAHARYPFAE